jgi:hypothetical protein
MDKDFIGSQGPKGTVVLEEKLYRVSQEERTIFWEVIVSVILSKNFI